MSRVFREIKVPWGQGVAEDLMARPGLRDQRATLGTVDQRAQKAIRASKAKKDLLVLMVYRVSRVYRDQQVYKGPQAAMEQMEKMVILVIPGPGVLTELRVCKVGLDQRVTLSYQWTPYRGYEGSRGGTGTREILVSPESLDHKETQDRGALLEFLAIQGL